MFKGVIESTLGQKKVVERACSTRDFSEWLLFNRSAHSAWPGYVTYAAAAGARALNGWRSGAVGNFRYFVVFDGE